MKSTIRKSPYASTDYSQNNQANVRSQAVFLFSHTIIRGKIMRLLRFFKKRSVSLQDLQSYLTSFRVLNRSYKGVQFVKINQILGSEGRIKDFDKFFNPIHERTRSRWVNIARIRMSGSELPPVELIQVGEIYFVRDGHHRISVARAIGEDFIDAEVIEWDVLPNAKVKPTSTFLHNASAAEQSI
jgi:hypothetical protein